MTTNRQTPAADTPGDGRSGVFISYKHNRYRRQAEDLHRFLTTFSAPAWLDIKEISHPHQVPRQELEEALRQAVANGRLLAFFETVDALEHDESVGDENKV